MKQFLIIISTFIFAISATAQTVKISGNVSDIDGKPIELVTIQAKNTTTGTMTDLRGRYSFDVASHDSLTLIFSCIGYHKTQRILPKLTTNITLNVVMRENTMELDEFTVIATRQRQSSSMQTLDADKIRLLPDPSGGSIESLIVTFAGVSSTSELSSQYNVRGGNYDENIVYVNGIAIHRPLLIRSGEQEGLSFINPYMTSTVNFSAGGYDAKYGDKMSSVLDIQYKQPEGFEAAATASFLGGNLYVGSSGKKYSQVTGVRYKTNQSLLSTMDTKGEYNPKFLDVQTLLTYKLTSKWEASFLGNLSQNKYEFTPKKRETSFGTLDNAQNFTVYFDGWENDRFETLFGAFTLKGKVSDNSTVGLQASTFTSDEVESYDITGEYWLNELNIDPETGVSSTGNLLGVGSYHEHARNRLKATVSALSVFGNHKIKAQNIQWGLSAHLEKITDRIGEWEMRDSAGYSLPYNGTTVNVITNLYSSNEVNSKRFSGYLQDTYKFRIDKGLFNITAGIRGSYWTFNEELIISPRASISYIPNSSNLELRFASGLYYQAPFYKEFRKTISDAQGNSIIELNKQIKSQKSFHFVLGGDYFFKVMDRPFKFTSEVYYKILSDLVPYTVDNVKVRYYGENLTNGYAAGLDMKLFGEFVPGTDSWLSFSLMKAEQTLNGVQVPLPTDQRYNISLYFQDYFPGYERIKMNLVGIWSQGLPVSAPRVGYDKGFFRASDYRRIDIGFSWQALHKDSALRAKSAFWNSFKNVWFGIDVFNLLNIHNVNSYYWVTDVYQHQYAVPNYLTLRQLNVRVLAEW